VLDDQTLHNSYLEILDGFGLKDYPSFSSILENDSPFLEASLEYTNSKGFTSGLGFLNGEPLNMNPDVFFFSKIFILFN